MLNCQRCVEKMGKEGMGKIPGDDLPWTNGIKGKCDGRFIHGVGERGIRGLEIFLKRCDQVYIVCGCVRTVGYIHCILGVVFE